MASGNQLQKDPQQLPGKDRATQTTSPPTAAHLQQQQPQPTTSKAPTPPSTQECEVPVAASVEDDIPLFDLSRYQPVSSQEGAGSYKVHTIPKKLLESLTTHEIASVWPKLKHEVGKKIWGERSGWRLVGLHCIGLG